MSQDDAVFSIHAEQDKELEDLQRQVMELQEDVQVRHAQDAAAKEEGQRKSTGTAAAAAAAVAAKNTSIFIAGCDPKTTENDLRLFFTGCGNIKRITIMKDRFTGQPRGNCYVEFETEEGMNAAVAKDGQACHGRPLKVAVKRESGPPPPGGRGGGMPYGAGFRGGMMMPRGRGGFGGPMPPPQHQMALAQQQMMANMMMMMGAGGQPGMPFQPYGAPRGRGRGFGGPGRGGRPY